MTTKSTYQAGDRILAHCNICDKAMWFKVLSVTLDILTCRNIEYPAENVEYKIKESQVIDWETY